MKNLINKLVCFIFGHHLTMTHMVTPEKIDFKQSYPWAFKDFPKVQCAECERAFEPSEFFWSCKSENILERIINFPNP